MPNCPICNQKIKKEKFREKFFSSFSNLEYKLYHCQGCDLQWWEPLKMIPEFYEREGEKIYKYFHLGVREKLEERHKMFFKFIPLRKGKLLDVGCGDGIFLEEAQRRGYEVWGIDFDKKSIRVCQKIRGLKNTFVATPHEFLKYCQEKKLKFEIITFFDVLEHQDEPFSFLFTFKKMLQNGGYIAGSVPNRDSWFMKIERKIFQADNPPHHFLRFSLHSLTQVLRRLNYHEILIFPISLPISEISFYLQVFLLGDKINNFLRKKLTRSIYASEKTVLFQKLPFWKKLLLKALKMGRTAVLLLPAALMKFLAKGHHLYFQAKFQKNENG